METIDYKGISLRRWNCGPSTFLARPELGARLMNWNVRMSDGSFRDVIYWPEDANYDNFAKVRGGNPILFPFSARTYDKGRIGFWRDASGTVRPMPQHGFTRNGSFELSEINDTGFTALFTPDAIAQEAYPFDYRFTVKYLFAETSFKVFFKLENLEDTVMLWSAGHHFYFTLPWHPERTRNDYRFEIPAKQCFTHAEDGSLVAEQTVKKEADFADEAIVDRIFTGLTSNEVRFGPVDGTEDVSIRILDESTTDPTWNTFVVWTETAKSPFYCVEPWMGPPNSPEHKMGLHTVEKGHPAVFGVEVSMVE